MALTGNGEIGLDSGERNRDIPHERRLDQTTGASVLDYNGKSHGSVHRQLSCKANDNTQRLRIKTGFVSYKLHRAGFERNTLVRVNKITDISVLYCPLAHIMQYMRWYVCTRKTDLASFNTIYLFIYVFHLQQHKHRRTGPLNIHTHIHTHTDIHTHRHTDNRYTYNTHKTHTHTYTRRERDITQTRHTPVVS